MKNKFKMMLLGVLCIICLQVSLTAYAFDTATDHDFELPLYPLPGTESTSVTPDGSPAEQSSKAADKITSDISNPAASSSKTTDKSDTEEKSASSGKTESSSKSSKNDGSSAIHSDGDYIELPVITADGEPLETSKSTSAADNEPSRVSELSNASEGSDKSVSSGNSSDTQKQDTSLSGENDSSRGQTAASAENSETTESNGSGNLPIIIAAICGTAVIAAGAVFVVIKKTGK